MKEKQFFCRFETRRKVLGPIGEPIAGPEPIIDFLRKTLFNDAGEFWRETFVAVYLNASSRPLGYEVISVGGTCSCTFDLKPVCRTAVDTMSAKVIVVHNHPSGDCKPSKSDIEETSKLKKALDLLDIKLLDHIILTEKEAFSFSQEKTFKR